MDPALAESMPSPPSHGVRRFDGEHHPQFGKRGAASHMYGRKFSEETRLKMSEARKRRHVITGGLPWAQLHSRAESSV